MKSYKHFKLPHWTVFQFLLHPHEDRIFSVNIFLKRVVISFRHKDYRTENRCVSNSSKIDEVTDERKYKYDCYFQIRCICLWGWKWKLLSHVQLFVTPWTTVHGILQARILEWVAFSFPSGLSWPSYSIWISCFAGGFFTNWAIREAPKYYIA